MSTYDVKVTITCTTTVRVSGRDEDDALDNLYTMIENGEVDLVEAFDDFEVEHTEDVSEEIWGCNEYSRLSEEGVL